MQQWFRLAVGLALGWLLLLPATAAHAQTEEYVATLTGPSESPPNTSPGVGFSRVTLNPFSHTLRVEVSFSGLQGTTTASHIHTPTPAPGSGTAGVATTTPTFPGFPLGVTSGTYDQTFNLTLASSYNPVFVTANGGSVSAAEAALISGIRSGSAYLNIHTTVVPGGEIRGFLQAAPEPSTAVLLLPSLTLLPLLRRKRPAPSTPTA